jgi:hypothetical protein
VLSKPLDRYIIVNVDLASLERNSTEVVRPAEHFSSKSAIRPEAKHTGRSTTSSSIPRSTANACYDTASVSYSSFIFKGLHGTDCCSRYTPLLLSHPRYWLRLSASGLVVYTCSRKNPTLRSTDPGIVCFSAVQDRKSNTPAYGFLSAPNPISSNARY